MGRGPHALHRDHVGHRRVGMNAPPVDVQVIDLSGGLEHVTDLDAHILGDAALFRLVRGVPYPHDEPLPHPRPHRCDDVQRQAQPRSEGFAPVTPVQVVGQRGHELVQQMAVSHDFHPVQPRRLHPLRRIGKIGDDAGNVPVFRCLGKGPVRRFAVGG